MSKDAGMRIHTGKQEHSELAIELTFDEADELFRSLLFWSQHHDGKSVEVEHYDDDGGRKLVLNIAAQDPDSDPWGVKDPE
jgi:hypothetical protein